MFGKYRLELGDYKYTIEDAEEEQECWFGEGGCLESSEMERLLLEWGKSGRPRLQGYTRIKIGLMNWDGYTLLILKYSKSVVRLGCVFFYYIVF